jgi:hypothetical protein
MSRAPSVTLSVSRQISDFTEASYRKVLSAARAKYAFEFFGTTCRTPHVLWRHDVDLSVHRALKLAEIEARLGVKSTYFFLLHSEFYNLLETQVTRRARAIVELGHSAALHFHPGYYRHCNSLASLTPKLQWERRLLEDVIDTSISAFSLHDPTRNLLRLFTRRNIGGMINVYGASLRRRYEYCSDSNGYWRHKRLIDVIQSSTHTNLHVLTHAEWWVPSAMSPWKRVQRCVAGRSTSLLDSYERDLQRSRRINLGKSA